MAQLVLHSDPAFAQDLIVLRMVLNGEDKGEFFLVLTEDNDIWIRKDDLNRTDLVEGLGSVLQVSWEWVLAII